MNERQIELLDERQIKLLDGDLISTQVDAIFAETFMYEARNGDITESELRKLRKVLLVIFPERTLHWTIFNIGPRCPLKIYIRIVCSIFIESFLEKDQEGKTIFDHVQEMCDEQFLTDSSVVYYSDILSALKEF